ncbi:MAG TPA: DUF819 family protein [Longimicrobiales bacterium]|nr:DUF819 family protein [Longimicrobiales bacterium]
MIRDPYLLAAVLAAITALAFWLDSRYARARTLGATLLVIIFGAALSNAGVVPFTSPVYDVIGGPVTSLAIVWLLFAVDVRDLRAAGPRMAAAFGIAVTATALGACAAALLFADAFDGNAWRLAGVMTGTYAGGSINFVAVGRAVELPPALFTAATAADNVMTAVWFGATLMLPLWLGRHWRDPGPDAPEAEAGDGSVGGDAYDDHPFLSTTRLRVVDLALLLALGFAVIAASEGLAAVVRGTPAILWLTTVALLAGHTPWVRRLHGAMHLGSLGLHLFLAMIGILSRFSEILRVGPEVFWFTALVVLIHGAVTLGGCRLARLDLPTTAVASQAAVGGPSSALALAVARDWKGLVLPGVVVGLLGYAVGNYLGLAVAHLMRGVIGT